MSRRMEIEVTSVREGGGCTWRAAGAREPRGLLDPALAPAGVHVGDVLRVEVEADMDGITILSVLPPRGKNEVAGRIEVVGTPTELVPVTTTLAPRTERRRPSRFDGGDDRGARRPGRPGDRERSPGSPDRDRSGDRGRSGDRRPPERDGAARVERSGERRGERTASRPPGARTGEGPTGRDQRPAPADRPRGEGAPDRRPRGPAPAEERAKDGARPARGRPPRFVPGRARIDAVLGGLPPEQRPIADQLVAGGLPAVRRALAAAGDAGSGSGQGDANQAAILALAEQMLPAVTEALWLDRAEAAVESLEHLSLRDLRATVVGAVPRDDHGRDLDRQLREALDQRLTRLRDSWQTDMARALEDGRVLQALRLSGRPPEPSARFPASLVTPLSEAASSSMAPDTPPERWAALLEATLASPVRRYVKPAGLPTAADEAVLKTARQAAGRVPALAGLLGMAMPPPPGPAGPARPPAPPTGQGRPLRIPAPGAARRAPAAGEAPATTGDAGPVAVEASPVHDGVGETEAGPPGDTAVPQATATDDGTGATEAQATADAPGREAPQAAVEAPGAESSGAGSTDEAAAPDGQDAVHVEELSEAVNQG
jgi:hypothetical protein